MDNHMEDTILIEKLSIPLNLQTFVADSEKSQKSMFLGNCAFLYISPL